MLALARGGYSLSLKKYIGTTGEESSNWPAKKVTCWRQNYTVVDTHTGFCLSTPMQFKDWF